MARLCAIGVAALLPLLAACSIPVAEAPPEADQAAPLEIIGQSHPPIHTAAYSQAISDSLSWEPEDLAEFERLVSQDPTDWISRAKILAYAHRADQFANSENLARRKTHVFWLVEHDPANEILSSYLGNFMPADLTTEDWSRTVALWDAAAKAHPGDDRVLANAANFFREADSARRRRYLELAAETAPENAWYGLALGEIYAIAILRAPHDATPEGLRQRTEAERILDTTNNAAIVEVAARILTSDLTHPKHAGRPAPAVQVERAERMVQRARELNPEVDMAWIQPAAAPPLEYQPPNEEQIAAAQARVVRLHPSDFPELPPGLASFLEERRCGIPQITGAKDPMNLVRGAFFAAGEPGWAVICSAGGQSEILVFRNDEDRDPYILSSGPDAICLAAEWNCGSYQLAISPADREFILYHYRAYGGTEPPPIDHGGLDVAIVEKASAVHYFYEGEWLSLAGAD